MWIYTNGYFWFTWIVICSQKASQGQNTDNTDTTTPPITGTMVYEGATDKSGASPSACIQELGSHAIAGIVGITVAIWQFGLQGFF